MAITLSVTGMTCGHCVQSVTKALQAVAGVEKVSVSLDTGRARVDGKASPGVLIRAIEEEGYKAQVADSK
ncbi:MAG: heavy-metal-associated domain-containing protein [Betaproteobacteria bacterium]|nr:heavy-metal-associated domain-containing protein [Betaproteobacteria bacterium]